jgi:hypothetical protein
MHMNAQRLSKQPSEMSEVEAANVGDEPPATSHTATTTEPEHAANTMTPLSLAHEISPVDQARNWISHKFRKVALKIEQPQEETSWTSLLQRLMTSEKELSKMLAAMEQREAAQRAAAAADDALFSAIAQSGSHSKTNLAGRESVNYYVTSSMQVAATQRRLAKRHTVLISDPLRALVSTELAAAMRRLNEYETVNLDYQAKAARLATLTQRCARVDAADMGGEKLPAATTAATKLQLRIGVAKRELKASHEAFVVGSATEYFVAHSQLRRQFTLSCKAHTNKYD